MCKNGIPSIHLLEVWGSVPTLPELSPSVAVGRLRKKLSPTNRSGNGCLTWLVTSQGTLRNVWRGPLLPPYCRAAHYDGQPKYIQKVCCYKVDQNLWLLLELLGMETFRGQWLLVDTFFQNGQIFVDIFKGWLLVDTFWWILVDTFVFEKSPFWVNFRGHFLGEF